MWWCAIDSSLARREGKGEEGGNVFGAGYRIDMAVNIGMVMVGLLAGNGG